jgi:hypothetical protein
MRNDIVAPKRNRSMFLGVEYALEELPVSPRTDALPPAIQAFAEASQEMLEREGMALAAQMTEALETIEHERGMDEAWKSRFSHHMEKWWAGKESRPKKLDWLHKERTTALTEASNELDQLDEMEKAAEDLRKQRKKEHDRARWGSLRLHCTLIQRWEDWEKCNLYQDNPRIAGFSTKRVLPSSTSQSPSKKQQLQSLTPEQVSKAARVQLIQPYEEQHVDHLMKTAAKHNTPYKNPYQAQRDWIFRMKGKNQGRTFYYNKRTGIGCWILPEHVERQWAFTRWHAATTLCRELQKCMRWRKWSTLVLIEGRRYQSQVVALQCRLRRMLATRRVQEVRDQRRERAEFMARILRGEGGPQYAIAATLVQRRFRWRRGMRSMMTAMATNRWIREIDAKIVAAGGDHFMDTIRRGVRYMKARMERARLHRERAERIKHTKRTINTLRLTGGVPPPEDQRMQAYRPFFERMYELAANERKRRAERAERAEREDGVGHGLYDDHSSAGLATVLGECMLLVRVSGRDPHLFRMCAVRFCDPKLLTMQITRPRTAKRGSMYHPAEIDSGTAACTTSITAPCPPPPPGLLSVTRPKKLLPWTKVVSCVCTVQRALRVKLLMEHVHRLAWFQIRRSVAVWGKKPGTLGIGRAWRFEDEVCNFHQAGGIDASAYRLQQLKKNESSTGRAWVPLALQSQINRHGLLQAKRNASNGLPSPGAKMQRWQLARRPAEPVRRPEDLVRPRVRLAERYWSGEMGVRSREHALATGWRWEERLEAQQAAELADRKRLLSSQAKVSKRAGGRWKKAGGVMGTMVRLDMSMKTKKREDEEAEAEEEALHQELLRRQEEAKAKAEKKAKKKKGKKGAKKKAEKAQTRASQQAEAEESQLKHEHEEAAARRVQAKATDAARTKALLAKMREKNKGAAKCGARWKLQAHGHADIARKQARLTAALWAQGFCWRIPKAKEEVERRRRRRDRGLPPVVVVEEKSRAKGHTQSMAGMPISVAMERGVFNQNDEAADAETDAEIEEQDRKSRAREKAAAKARSKSLVGDGKCWAHIGDLLVAHHTRWRLIERSLHAQLVGPTTRSLSSSSSSSPYSSSSSSSRSWRDLDSQREWEWVDVCAAHAGRHKEQLEAMDWLRWQRIKNGHLACMECYELRGERQCDACERMEERFDDVKAEALRTAREIAALKQRKLIGAIYNSDADGHHELGSVSRARQAAKYAVPKRFPCWPLDQPPVVNAMSLVRVQAWGRGQNVRRLGMKEQRRRIRANWTLLHCIGEWCTRVLVRYRTVCKLQRWVRMMLAKKHVGRVRSMRRARERRIENHAVMLRFVLKCKVKVRDAVVRTLLVQTTFREWYFRKAKPAKLKAIKAIVKRLKSVVMLQKVWRGHRVYVAVGTPWRGKAGTTWDVAARRLQKWARQGKARRGRR